jgi:hypothetical protein
MQNKLGNEDLKQTQMYNIQRGSTAAGSVDGKNGLLNGRSSMVAIQDAKA